MSEVSATPITLKCKICGGDIVNDYLAGSCVCAHCGNKWPLAELVPDYSRYTHVITKINQANDLLAGEPRIETLEQAKLLFQSASRECDTFTGPIATDLIKVCRDGQTAIQNLKIYAKAKKQYDKKSYSSAKSEFKKIPGFKDSDELLKNCEVEIEKGRKKRIPLAVIVGMVIPAVLCVILKEVVGIPLLALIPIFLLCSAGVGYLIYRGGALAIVIDILSFLSAVPLILFMILAYGFHVPTVPSAIIAVAGPIVLIAIFGIMVERKT